MCLGVVLSGAGSVSGSVGGSGTVSGSVTIHY